MTTEPRVDDRFEILVAEARYLLTQITDDLSWAYGYAYDTPQGPAPAERPPSLAYLEGKSQEDLDAEAPPFDIGIGNHAAQRAVSATGPRLAAAERDLELACRIAATERRQPALIQPDDGAAIHTLALTLACLAWRVERLSWAGRDTGLVGPCRLARPSVIRANNALRSACGGLGKALNRGPLGHPGKGDALCAICKIRPRASKGRRCHTCEKWKVRNGTERPRKLDTAVVAEARAAQERRAVYFLTPMARALGAGPGRA